jgi:hypothetical protein
MKRMAGEEDFAGMGATRLDSNAGAHESRMNQVVDIRMYIDLAASLPRGCRR